MNAQAPLQVVCPRCGAINRIPPGRPAGEAKCGGCHCPLFAGKPLPVDAKSFDRHIRRNDIPVVVDFWADWCGPCHAMAPALDRAAAELEPRFRILKLDVEREQEVAARYGIRSIPTLILFAGGGPVAQTAGAMDASRLVSWIESQAAGIRDVKPDWES